MDDGGDEVLDELGAEGQRCDVICSSFEFVSLTTDVRGNGDGGDGYLRRSPGSDGDSLS